MEHPLPIPGKCTHTEHDRYARSHGGTGKMMRTFRNFMMNQLKKIQRRKNFPQKRLHSKPLRIPGIFFLNSSAVYDKVTHFPGSVPEALLMRGLYLSVTPANFKRPRSRRRKIRASPTSNPSLRSTWFLLYQSCHLTGSNIRKTPNPPRHVDPKRYG